MHTRMLTNEYERIPLIPDLKLPSRSSMNLNHVHSACLRCDVDALRLSSLQRIFDEQVNATIAYVEAYPGAVQAKKDRKSRSSFQSRICQYSMEMRQSVLGEYGTAKATFSLSHDIFRSVMEGADQDFEDEPRDRDLALQSLATTIDDPGMSKSLTTNISCGDLTQVGLQVTVFLNKTALELVNENENLGMGEDVKDETVFRSIGNNTNSSTRSFSVHSASHHENLMAIKRSVHALLDTVSTRSGITTSDAPVSLSNKRIRLRNDNNETIGPRLKFNSTLTSSDVASSRIDHESASSSTDCSHRSTITSILPKGFAGQFQIFRPHELRNFKIFEGEVIWGTRCHANGRFANIALTLDPKHLSRDLTMDQVNDDLAMASVITMADGMARKAASDYYAKIRSYQEDYLRTEGHRECAMARLEGVSVGLYRYYQGHLTLEEYKDAGMCVCWDSCFCSKLCTTYGDMICPCNGAIVLRDE